MDVARGGMGIIRILGANGQPVKSTGAEELQHTLVFYDGRQLRGLLTGITDQDVEWKRPDMSAALKFARAEVRRIYIKDPSQTQARQVFAIQNEAAASAAETTSSGTVKLSGGDWLFGTVTSDDGKRFTMKIASDASLQLDRSCMAWLHVGGMAAPAYGFSGGPLDLEGWTAGGSAPTIEVEKGTATIKDGEWIGRATSPLQRFDLSFELPEDSEQGTRVWLQPIGPEINCYTTGTVVLNLGNKEFSHVVYANKMNNVSTTVPEASRNQKGPPRYRVLYDGPNQRMIIFRNGSQLGDFKFFDDKDPDAQAAKREVQITGLCFDRSRGQNEPLRLNRVRLQPWDGKVAALPAQQGDCILSGDGDPRIGNLGAVADKELTFGDQKIPRKSGMLLQFPNEPEQLAAADALLSFGTNGEISAGNLVIENGQIRCKTAFSDKLQVPMKELEVISFATNGAIGERGKADVLVFKNGDEIPGQLVAASSEADLRWRTANGQEIEIQRKRVAGVRLLSLVGPDKVAKDTATVELRNGDRLHANIQRLDHEALEIQHEVLGAKQIARTQLWAFHPNAALSSRDGGFMPDAWIAGGVQVSENSLVPGGRKPGAQWSYIDGSYILRPQSSRRFSSSNGIGLLVPVPSKADRYELRMDVTDAGGGAPNFALYLTDENNRTSMQASFGYGRLQVYLYSRNGRGGPNWKQIPLDSKLKELYSRHRLRVFVDSVNAAVDFYLDGVSLGRIALPKGDKQPGFGKRMRINSYGQNVAPLIVSNVWVGPWNGELPRPGGVEAGVALSNGDFATGDPGEMTNGSVRVATDLGPFELPAGKITSVQFGGEIAPKQTVGRVRFADGSAINVDSFAFEGGKLTAKSATLGDIQISAEAVTELAFSPAPLRPPQSPATKTGVTEELVDNKAAPDK
jgi:hypothetical protein